MEHLNLPEHLLEVVFGSLRQIRFFPGGTILLHSELQNIKVLHLLCPISNYIHELKCEHTVIQSLSSPWSI